MTWRAAILVLALALAAAPAHAVAFVAGTEDVPLMQGLTPVPGSDLVFDKPQGRIVEAEASGNLRRDAVSRFYAATLPQLGWRDAGRNAWRRDGEELRLGFRGRDGDLTVSFTLEPHLEPHP